MQGQNVLPVQLDKLLTDYQNDVSVNVDENGIHQPTPLDNLLEGIVNNNQAIESRLETIEKQIAPPPAAEISTLDKVVGYLPFVFALIVCLLIVRLIYVGSKNSQGLSDAELRIKALEENKQLRNDVELLKTEISSLKDRLKKESAELPTQQKNYVTNPLPTKNNFSNPSATTFTKQAPAPPPPPAYTDFVDEYNSLKILQGRDLRSGIDNFIRKYDVKGFACENAQERLNNPDAEPRFAECPPNRCDYWLYQSRDGKIIVVPSASVTTYNNNFHNERAMSTLFDSNFVGGANYSEILVQRPAILSSSWNIEQKGMLRLS